VRLLVLLAIAVAAGCSPSRDIADRASRIAERARLDDEAWSRVGDAHPDMMGESAAGRLRAQQNLRDTTGIHKSLTGVEDSTPWWASTITWVAGATVAVVVLLVLWRSGALTAVRILIGWIPRQKMTQAELAVDMLDESRPEGDRELVSAMRAQDAEFDAAFRKAQQRRKAK